MNFKKLLALTFASLAMGNVASIAQITPIDQCNVKDMTMCGSDLYVATNEGYLIFDTKVGETKEMKTVGKLTSIIAKSETDLWYTVNLGRSSTINHVNGTETTTYSVANGAIKGGPYADVGAKGLAYGPDNTVWFGAYGFFTSSTAKNGPTTLARLQTSAICITYALPSTAMALCGLQERTDKRTPLSVSSTQ